MITAQSRKTEISYVEDNMEKRGETIEEEDEGREGR
jgi:hypothetical protein